MACTAVTKYNPAVPHSPHHHDDDLDKFHEECALFGIYGSSDAAAHTALGLHALQHRGQTASGIVSYDGRHFHNHRAAGLVGEIFGEQSVIATLKATTPASEPPNSSLMLRPIKPSSASFLSSPSLVSW